MPGFQLFDRFNSFLVRYDGGEEASFLHSAFKSKSIWSYWFTSFTVVGCLVTFSTGTVFLEGVFVASVRLGGAVMPAVLDIFDRGFRSTISGVAVFMWQLFMCV